MSVTEHQADPPGLQTCSKAAQRTYDTLAEADDSLSRSEIQRETRHAQSTVVKALGELREAGLAERHEQWPVPTYEVADP